MHKQLTWNWLPPACFLLAYYSAFLSYQNYRSQGYSFHTFCFLGHRGVGFPQMLYFAPLFLFSCLVQLRGPCPPIFCCIASGTGRPRCAARDMLSAEQRQRIDGMACASNICPTDCTILDEHKWCRHLSL